MTSSLLAAAREWASGDPDPETRAEVERLVEARDVPALEERFHPPLRFGTAGLRGIVGAGPARMNDAVIRRTTRALAEYLLATVPDAKTLPVIVGFDARHSSRAFAESVIAVLVAARIPVRFFPEPVPTPLVAYAVRQFAGSAGIAVTASHNPAKYNGYKLYGASGSQIVPPVDADIERRTFEIGPANRIAYRDPAPGDERSLARPVPPSIIERYLADALAILPAGRADRDFSIVYTPLHGVGGALAQRALVAAGFLRVYTVARQAAPDGDFPTVAFPNPEEPGTLDLALALAEETSAELVLANDPDADRLAVCVRSAAGRMVPLSGNQIGVLLADFVLEHTPPGTKPLVVWSIVSSPLLGAIAEAYGARAERTLTGFKWIARAGAELERWESLRYVFGYEEALGYAACRAVRDKDGISAAVLFAELAAHARADGQSVLDRLARLYRRHGLWVSAQENVTRAGTDGPAALLRAVDGIASNPPASLAGKEITGITDFRDGAAERPEWLGATPLVVLELGEQGRVLLRPSGTEPKLKIYVDYRVPLTAEASVWEAEERGIAEARALAKAAASLIDGAN